MPSSPVLRRLGVLSIVVLVAWSSSAMAASVGDAPVLDRNRASGLDVERPSNFAIPDAADRPRLPTAGPFFDVRDVRIEGITDREDIGLSVERLVVVAREELSRQADEQEIADQGYSDEELLEVARFLDQVKARRDDTDFTKVALFNQLNDLLEGFEGRRGISVFDLEAVASAVQDRVRDTGLILAQVVVPPQTVRDGLVTLRVYPGRLGGVELVNNEVYEQATFERAFASAEGKAVELNDIDERLRLVNDFNGIDVSGVFVPGKVPGETQLQLNAVNERRWSVTERIDNHGAESTGRTRGLIAFGIYDPTGAGDEINATFIRSEGPDPAIVAALSYLRPIDDIKSFIQVGYTRNEFAIGGLQDVRGDTRNYDVAFGTHWIRKRDRNFNQTVHVAYKDSEILIGAGASQLDNSQQVTEFGTTLTYDALVSDWRAIVEGSTTLTVGSIQDGRIQGDTDTSGRTFPGQDKNYVILAQNLRLFKLFELPVPFVDAISRHSVLFRVNAQYSEQSVPAVDKFNLGGADGVRSLLSDDISVDKGIIANMNLYWQIPEALDFDIAFFDQKFSDAFRPYVFYDYANGVLAATQTNANDQDDIWFDFAAYGVGFEYNFQKNNRGGYDIHGSVGWARSDSLRFGDEAFAGVIEDTDRIYADITIEIDQNSWPFFGGRK